jgi:hypothetical protein
MTDTDAQYAEAERYRNTVAEDLQQAIKIVEQVRHGLYNTGNAVHAFDSPKPLRDFIQLDGWADAAHKKCDSIMLCDDDGDILMRGQTREPQRSGTTVRILVAAGADPADVLRILRKQLAWLERDSLAGVDEVRRAIADHRPDPWW